MFSYCALSEYLIWWKYFIFCYIYSWKIKTKSGRLRLSFSEFDLESGAECSKEYLQVKISSQDPTEEMLKHILSCLFSICFVQMDGPVQDHGRPKLCGNNVSFFICTSSK